MLASARPLSGVLCNTTSRLALQRHLRSTVAAPSRRQASSVNSRPCVRMSAATPAAADDYDQLVAKLKDISALSGINGLLGWDEMVMLPAGAGDARAAQKSALASVIHQKSTDKTIGDLLERLQSSNVSSFDDFQRANIREAAREYRKAVAVPDALVRREAELESHGYATWVKARQANDFSLFAPVLKEWVEARKERARLVDPSGLPYDVLADDYSAGLTAARVEEIFTTVKESLIPFLAELRTRGTAPDASWLSGKTFDTDKQAELCKEVAVALGFDLERGRLDVSVHPFTGGYFNDVRMTTRFKEHDLTEGLTGAVHETGHALYEQGRNSLFEGLPVSSAAGMAIHESQSLLWERCVALSLPFAKYLLPKLQAAFTEQLPKEKTPEDLYAAFNVIKDPSKIRVESDEVTYPMHIILRFEIEKGLIEGSIQIEDIPEIWNAKMKEYLGVDITSNAEGCLQDVHWSAGLFGYFPTYTLGAMAATQIFEAARRDLPALDSDIEAGNFAGLKAWLNKKVHAVGSLHPTADDLLIAVTGKPLDPSVFLAYLKDKYSKLYKL